ncbi:MAG: 3-hydroxyacyl-ACP dehydratase FabZ [Bdellovibrionaceae bacterium]|nr:3-hydroxyacyl-ACP dehydratase FabZ [Pseudobdellovibrionaceae bacterium]
MPSVLSVEEIKKRIPHRFPFLLVDEVTQVDYLPEVVGSKILALKNISAEDPVFKGHFPGKPIFPGVLIIEALAQSMGVLMSFDKKPHSVPLLGRIKNAKFKSLVLPGDQLVLSSVIIKYRKPNVLGLTKAFVNDKLVAEAELLCHLK